MADESLGAPVPADDADEVGEMGVVGCLPRLLDPLHSREIRLMASSLRHVTLSGDSSKAEKNLDRYQLLLGIYENQPTLLDSIVPELMETLLGCISLPTKAGSESLDAVSIAGLRYLAHLCTARGYKIIVRLLPHHVSYLEKVLLCLEQFTNPLGGDLIERRMLLLWLWIVCKNPFDLRRFDPVDQPGLSMRRIFSVAMPYFDCYQNSCQYAAALVVSQCLARTDGVSMVTDVVENCLSKIDNPGSEHVHGYLTLLLAILKHVDRKYVIPLVDRMVSALSAYFPVDSAKIDKLMRKALIKLSQRLALIVMKPRVAVWRYRRGKRRLEENLMDAAASASATMPNGNGTANGNHSLPSTSNGSTVESANSALPEEADDDFDVPEIIEWSLGGILGALSDDDSEVRWSAAKGVGRIAARLPRQLASQVVDSIVSSQFHPLSGHGAWHGGCMALAELSRRGLLLPESLPSVFPLIQDALFYEEPMGRNSLGSQVRDAACYVLWAFARAYEPAELRPYVHRVATSLMCVAMFDRQVSLRRAASAAFQENVGRQADFPDGIALLTIADFFAVGNRERCYSSICSQVIKFPTYANAIIDHLVEKKVCYWDESVRQQAARALCLLAPLHSHYLASKLPELLQQCTANNTVRRHGSLFALSHSILGLTKAGYKIDASILNAAADLPCQLTGESKKLKSAGGEMTRIALNEFIYTMSLARIHLSTDQISAWLGRIEAAAVDDTDEVREKAARAASAFFSAYLTQKGDKGADEILSRAQASYVAMLSSPTRENCWIGVCCLAAAIPPTAVTDALFCAISAIIMSPSKLDQKWARSRAAAAESLSVLYARAARPDWSSLCFDTLFRALEDYTEDIKGDIGRLVRQKTMCCLADLLTSSSLPDSLRETHVALAVRRMVQQSAEKIGRTRECACSCVMRLLACPSTRLLIAHSEVLESVYTDSHSFVQDYSLLTLGPVLRCDDYFVYVLHGLIISAGGLSSVTIKHAVKVISEYMSTIKDDLELLERFMQTIDEIFTSGMKVSRIGDSVLRCLDLILAQLPDNSAYLDASKSVARIMKKLSVISGSVSAKPRRTRLALSAFAAILSAAPECKHGKTAINKLTGALSSPIPAIRRVAATALYEALCLTDTDENILSLLSDTVWHDTVDMDSITSAADDIQKALAVC